MFFIKQSVRSNFVYWLLVILVAGWCLFWTFDRLDKFPHIWVDEGVFIQMAQMLGERGLLTIPVGPGLVSTQPFLYSISTAYPVLWPVTGAIHLFGLNLWAARLPMALYLLGTIGLGGWLFYKIFDRWAALLATAMLAVFPSLFFYGKPVQGEVPAFFWLLMFFGSFFWSSKSTRRATGQIFLAGIFLGLGATAKIPFAPGMVLLLLWWWWSVWQQGNRSIGTTIAVSGLGFIIPIFFWCYWANPNFWSLDFYLSAGQVIREFTHGARQYNWLAWSIFSQESTLGYFLLLTVFILGTVFCWHHYQKEKLSAIQRFLFGAVVLLVLWFAYWFIKSPGWLRYLFPLQLILLLSTVASWQWWRTRAKKFWQKIILIIFISSLVLLSAGKLWSGRNYGVSDLSNWLIAWRENYLITSQQSLGVYDRPEVAALLPPGRYWQYLSLLRPDGVNLLDKKLDIVIIDKKSFATNLFWQQNYEINTRHGDLLILQRKNQ